MAGTQGAHNSGEIIIWVGNNYCPKADIFGRQSLAITALVVQSFYSAITQIKIYSVDNAIAFPNDYPLDLVINFIQQIALSNDWTTGANPLTCSNSKINHFQGFLQDLILDWETELIWTMFTTGLFRDFTLMLLPYSVLKWLNMHVNSLCPQRILMLNSLSFLVINKLIQIIHDRVLCERLKAYFLSSFLFICSLLLQLMKYIINNYSTSLLVSSLELNNTVT